MMSLCLSLGLGYGPCLAETTEHTRMIPQAIANGNRKRRLNYFGVSVAVYVHLVCNACDAFRSLPLIVMLRLTVVLSGLFVDTWAEYAVYA